MLCTTCDTRNEEGSRFCRMCGSVLGAPAAASTGQTRPIYTIAQAPMVGPICPACIRANPHGAKYCVYCAAALTPAAPPVSAPAWQPAYAIPVSYVPPRPSPTLTIALNASGGLLTRAIWFFFIGWWLGLVWTILAWMFNLTLIGLPVGAMMLNAIPQVMTLRPRRGLRVQVSPGGEVFVRQPAQHPLALRALWFLLIGSWASLLWMLIAWAFSATILLLPIGFWMFERVPTITTLAAES